MRSTAFTQCRAILFDYGGTLDSHGVRWPDRFHSLMVQLLPHLTADEIKRAFYYAEERCHRSDAAHAHSLRSLITAHVDFQLETLGLQESDIKAQLIDQFCSASERCMQESALLLERLESRFRLGVVSNFYGNLADLLGESGILRYFDVVIDSGRVGWEKPSQEIFREALKHVALDAEQVIFVGDSYERDMLPSKALGMRTIWLAGTHAPGESPGADACISNLKELEELLL